MGYESRLYIVRKCKIQISPESSLKVFDFIQLAEQGEETLDKAIAEYRW